MRTLSTVSKVRHSLPAFPSLTGPAGLGSLASLLGSHQIRPTHYYFLGSAPVPRIVEHRGDDKIFLLDFSSSFYVLLPSDWYRPSGSIHSVPSISNINVFYFYYNSSMYHIRFNRDRAGDTRSSSFLIIILNRGLHCWTPWVMHNSFNWVFLKLLLLFVVTEVLAAYVYHSITTNMVKNEPFPHFCNERNLLCDRNDRNNF